MDKKLFDAWFDAGFASSYEESINYVNKIIEQVETTPNEELSPMSKILISLGFKEIVRCMQEEKEKLEKSLKDFHL